MYVKRNPSAALAEGAFLFDETGNAFPDERNFILIQKNRSGPLCSPLLLSFIRESRLI